MFDSSMKIPMKSFLLTLILSSVCAIAANPSDLDWSNANKTSVSIDAVEAASGKKTRDTFKTDYGSYDKDTIQTKRVLATARSSSTSPVAVTLETLWFVAPTASRSVDEMFLVYRDVSAESQVALSRNAVFESENTSKSNRTKYSALGESYTAGVKYAGYAVLARVGNKVIAYKTSVPTIARMISGNGKRTINQELKEYEEDTK